MRIFLISIVTFFCLQNNFAQTNGIPVYYTEVQMPAVLINNYYGQYDTKLLAEDLAGLLQKATGKTFMAIPYKPGETKGIFLLLDSNINDNSNEAGLLESDGKSFIRIKAHYTTGISYAMYSWLMELGFNFYLPGDEWTIIPNLNSIFNKTIIKKTFKPYFRMRMFYASGAIHAVKGLDEKGQNGKDWQQWHLRNRMGCDYIRIDGHIGEAFNIAHQEEIKKDSLILSPVNGKRKYSTIGKLDPTYKKGVSLFTDWIVDEFKKEQKSLPGFLPFKKYYTVDAGDGLDYCHTPECEKQFKSVSDQVFSIANETAKKIRLVDSRAGVSTMAYGERSDTPSIRIDANVHVMVVPTAFQYVSTAAELMQRWSKKTKYISQYDYLNIGVWSFDRPFFNLYQYHNYLQLLQSLKTEGITFETSFSKFSSGILQYFILKFLCDPYQSADQVLDQFCNANFEQAAAPVKKLFKEWYFSNVHLQTNLDYPTFYEDELGRFVQYLLEAENTPGISVAVKKRIEELKAYTIYLCKYYESFCELKSLQSYSTNPELRNEKKDALLTYTWQMYYTKIFHNTQLNDLLIQPLSDLQKEKWNYYKSDHFKGITDNAAAVIKSEFEVIRQKYLPLATPLYTITDSFLTANAKYSADSFVISTIDETSFGGFIYPLQFYCSQPGLLKIRYRTDSSQAKVKTGKIAIVGVESADYRFIKTDFIYKENNSGIITYRIPVKGHYKLYVSQYNTTHVSYVVYPGKNLFYHNKKSILMNGLMMQDNAEKNYYPNKYLAIYAPQADSIFFSNIYYSATNTSRLYTSDGKNIPVNAGSKPFNNSAALPKNGKGNFIFYENSQYRWPPVLKSPPPYYFYLKYPIK